MKHKELLIINHFNSLTVFYKFQKIKKAKNL